MTKGLAFEEFKQRYEALTIGDNGFGRIASDEELFKMFVAVAVIKEFDRENNSETGNANEREGDYAKGD